MFNVRQTAEIIDKLIELTQHDKIAWESQNPVPPMIGPESRVDIVYVASYIGRNIRVYQQHYKYYVDDERYVWEDQIVIEFVSDTGALLGRLPNTPNARELLEAIQFQNPQISSFYDELFSAH